ncbi:putative acylesterase/phospholipase RssA [Paraburkholderia sp. Clong3]|uniref:patatin-like phospholipase family protein n=1 Tax=Paraburkholderia sp. Clong3 TaxID=2991061 RepID=UPI003D20290D
MVPDELLRPERYQDADLPMRRFRLARGPARLLIGEVSVEDVDQRAFDSYVDRLTPDHPLASGNLPRAMPWTTIDGRAYWDGGIVSNSAPEFVIERCGRVHARSRS